MTDRARQIWTTHLKTLEQRYEALWEVDNLSQLDSERQLKLVNNIIKVVNFLG